MRAKIIEPGAKFPLYRAFSVATLQIEDEEIVAGYLNNRTDSPTSAISSHKLCIEGVGVHFFDGDQVAISDKASILDFCEPLQPNVLLCPAVSNKHMHHISEFFGVDVPDLLLSIDRQKGAAIAPRDLRDFLKNAWPVFGN